MIRERVHGKDHEEVAFVLLHLGEAYSELNDFAKGRELLERALMIRERVYGKDHPKVAFILACLGITCSEFDFANAQMLLERALLIQEPFASPVCVDECR